MIDDAKGDTDPKHRQETINKAMQYFHDQVFMIPLHLQVIPWASRANTSVIHRADNWLQATWVNIK
jgi:peptide/nickel transport system substrate-binding protein